LTLVTNLLRNIDSTGTVLGQMVGDKMVGDKMVGEKNGMDKMVYGQNGVLTDGCLFSEETRKL